jgi:hypothetical protein
MAAAEVAAVVVAVATALVAVAVGKAGRPVGSVAPVVRQRPSDKTCAARAGQMQPTAKSRAASRPEARLAATAAVELLRLRGLARGPDLSASDSPKLPDNAITKPCAPRSVAGNKKPGNAGFFVLLWLQSQSNRLELLRCSFRSSSSLLGSLVMSLLGLLGRCRSGSSRSGSSGFSSEGANGEHRGDQSGDQLFHEKTPNGMRLVVRPGSPCLWWFNAGLECTVDSFLKKFQFTQIYVPSTTLWPPTYPQPEPERHRARSWCRGPAGHMKRIQPGPQWPERSAQHPGMWSLRLIWAY